MEINTRNSWGFRAVTFKHDDTRIEMLLNERESKDLALQLAGALGDLMYHCLKDEKDLREFWKDLWSMLPEDPAYYDTDDEETEEEKEPGGPVGGYQWQG